MITFVRATTVALALAVVPAAALADEAAAESAGKPPDVTTITPAEPASSVLATDLGKLTGFLDAAAEPLGTTLTLKEALVLALANNHGLSANRFSVAAKDAAVAVARSGARPQLGLQGRAYWNTTNAGGASASSVSQLGAAGSGNDLQRSLGISLTQRLWDFGLTHDLTRAAQSQFGAELAVMEQAEQQLVRDVISAYYSYNLALGQERVRADELKLAQELLRQAQVQYDTGVAPQLDVIRAQSRLESSRTALVNAQAAVGNAAVYFYALLGVEDQRYVPKIVPAELIEPGQAPPPLDEAVETALEHRPELDRLRRAIAASDFAGQLTSNRPVIDAYATAGFALPATMGISDSYEYGVQVNWQLYSGGKSSAADRQACMEQAALLQNLADVQALIEADVTSAWNTVVAARSTVKSARRTLELATEAYRAAAIGYNAGVTPYVDYIDAMDAQVAAAIGYITSLAGVKTAQADLELALGFPNGYPLINDVTDAGADDSAPPAADPAWDDTSAPQTENPNRNAEE